MEVNTIIKRRNMGEYEIRDEIVNMEQYSGPGSKPLHMKCCYSTTDGSYMGVSKNNFITRWIRNYKLSKVQRAEADHTTASIGYCENWPSRTGIPTWVGWSHRAVCAFAVGDKLFDENFTPHLPMEERDQIPFIKFGSKTIRTLNQAKQAAINFAKYVS